MRPMISVSAMTGLLETITAAGGNPDQILSQVGLDRVALSDPEKCIACLDFARLLEETASRIGDPCFGLHFGEHFNPKSLGPVIYAVLNAPTTTAACQIAGRYLQVHNEAAKLSVSVENGQGYIRFLLNGLDGQTSRQYNEHAMTVVLNTIRLMIGSQWTPQEVHFPHRVPDQTTEHIRVFRAPVLFGCESNAFITSHEILERQVPGADPRLYQILQKYLDHALADIPREDKVLASVRKAIAETMSEGDPSLQRVGKQLALSPRTLQRRLKERGVSFNKLLDDTRRRFAIDYLKGQDDTLTQIAFLLGYSEVSAFNRAFKRWTDSTPSNYRRKTEKQEYQSQ